LNVLASHVQAKLLTGKVAVITGSGQGIGAAAAKLFAAHGAHVVVSDLDAAKSDAVALEITRSGASAISIPGDVTVLGFPEQLIEKTIARFGKLHYLVNNAGFTWDGMAHKMTDKQWETMLLIHQTAPFRFIRAAAPHMRDAGKAEKEANGEADDRCVINISSVSGTKGNIGQINYSTAKAGMLGMTRTVAKEWGPFGVRSNAIAYGMIDTRLTRAKGDGKFIQVDGQKVALGVPDSVPSTVDIKTVPKQVWAHIPLQRPGSVDDAAGAIFMMCSPFAGYVSGQCLEVSGGMV